MDQKNKVTLNCIIHYALYNRIFNEFNVLDTLIFYEVQSTQ